MAHGLCNNPWQGLMNFFLKGRMLNTLVMWVTWSLLQLLSFARQWEAAIDNVEHVGLAVS